MKAAIIGAGRMGRRHIIAAGAAGLDVVGISDLLQESLEEAKREGMSAKKCYTDASVMLRETKPQVVIVATTAPSHADLVALAVDFGATHVLCEKPLSISIDQAQKMIAHCAKNNVRLGVNHQMRYMEQYTKVKEIAGSPGMGGLVSISLVAGNIGMGMNGTHYFEAFRYLTDSPATTVQAWFSDENIPNPRGSQFLDKAGQIRLNNANGQRMYMDIGSDQGHGVVLTYGCRYGIIVVDELEGSMVITQRQEAYRDLPTTRYGMPYERQEVSIAPSDAVQPTVHVLQALLNERDWPDGECGLAAVKTLVAGYVSSEMNNLAVTISNELPEKRIFPWA